MSARLVVVSGGGTGLGRAIAGSFVSQGDEVVLIGRREAVLKEAAAAMDPGGERVRFVAADLTDPDQVSRAAQAIVQSGRTVDVLVNNAGAVAGRPAADLASTLGLWRQNLDSNLITAVLLTTAFMPHLSRPGGRVVSVSSIQALRSAPPAPGLDSYAAAKAALHAWTFALARKLGADGITANVVAPGYVPGTDIEGDEEIKRMVAQRWIAEAAIQRVGEASDVAGAVLYLASAEASYVTGQILQVNGGALVGR